MPVAPAVTYPAELPITERREEILNAIRGHQVVVVAGETGSGKSTQLPKLCLEAGFGVERLIGHTQPRRLAARTIAQRVSDELGRQLGDTVGYTVRFNDRVGANTMVRFMTDGILLNEIQRDRELRRYDVLIVDEAHERSLNIDFILGYLARLLPTRPDLKLIITSATIDTERFARHFGDAPVIEVSGRTYPVETRYRPYGPDVDQTDDERDQTQAILDAVTELTAEGPGDILVFLSGEREIRDTADALERLSLPSTEIVPLYARLSFAEQQRVFQPHGGRRITLATNVAETSLTVPGIRAVIDPGTARISRYSRRTKVQRLPIEAISQASANQRAGRCGRVGPGVCIRLYSEEDFLARPPFTEPEILRTNLASVVLQMAALRLGEVADFPFVDPPDPRAVKDGVALLEELGALRRDTDAAPGERLTRIGRQLARLPVDPRIGRMIIEAGRHGCVSEVVVLAAVLSIQDPRERPTDKRAAADESHARFADRDSDFFSLLNLWQYLQEQQEERSSNQFRRMCRTEFLNYLRVREWQDLHGQLSRIASDLDLRPNDEPADRSRVHRSLLAGLLSHIGVRTGERVDYLGARNTRFVIAPGSALFDKPPRWVMAAELVETNRLWARTAARIQPEWAEKLAGDLAKRTYSEPEWDVQRGRAVVHERVTLFGLPIVSARRVDLGRIDPELARHLFIRRALVEREWDTHHAFVRDNAATLDRARRLEDRARRGDLVVDDDTLVRWFEARVPEQVVSGPTFDRWWNQARHEHPDRLTLGIADVVDRGRVQQLDPDDFPDTWHQGDLVLPLSYVFDLDSPVDGVTVDIPLAVLNQVDAIGFDWHVPGMRRELVEVLIRTLPKELRRPLLPVGETTAAFLEEARPEDGALLDMLSERLGKVAGQVIPVSAWAWDDLPAHLRITFRAVDETGRAIATSDDLGVLQRRLGARTRAVVAGTAGAGLERSGLRSWTLGDLPRVVESRRGGHLVRGYPTLVDEGETAGVRVVATEDEQRRLMPGGVLRLLLVDLGSPSSTVRRLLGRETTLALARSQHASAASLIEQAGVAATRALADRHGGVVWDEASYARLREAVRADVVDLAIELVDTAAGVIGAADAIERRLDAVRSAALAPAVEDMRAQLRRLTGAAFIEQAGAGHLRDLPRYIQAIGQRLGKLGESPGRDRQGMARIHALEDAVVSADGDPAAVDEILWMLEELRVSVFAQGLGTSRSVSEQRIRRAIDDLGRR